ncbi:AlpA family phage regulatory protein, partial [Salmonella enterica]|nr:AlpA family phage regulatory protein [Salmonella enterica]
LSKNAFPRPVKIGTRAISFIESEVDHWIKEQISASRSGKTH